MRGKIIMVSVTIAIVGLLCAYFKYQGYHYPLLVLLAIVAVAILGLIILSLIQFVFDFPEKRIK